MNTSIIVAAMIIFLGIKEAANHEPTSRLTAAMIIVSLVCAASNDIRNTIGQARREVREERVKAGQLESERR